MSIVDPEEEMRQMVDALGIEIPEPTGDSSVQLLNEAELSKRFNKVTQELLGMGEAYRPHTQVARDLHSLREAYLHEMRRRGMR